MYYLKGLNRNTTENMFDLSTNNTVVSWIIVAIEANSKKGELIIPDEEYISMRIYSDLNSSMIFDKCRVVDDIENIVHALKELAYNKIPFEMSDDKSELIFHRYDKDVVIAFS